MTQRFMIARALLHHPSVLLLDEPFSGLDAAAQQFVVERIAQERQKGTSVIVTTHNTALGYLVGTRFLFMISGNWKRSQRKLKSQQRRYCSRMRKGYRYTTPKQM